MTDSAAPSVPTAPAKPRNPVVMGLVGFAVVLTLLQYVGLLPAWLHRLPEQFVPPLATWLDAIFNFIKEDLHLIDVTRFLTGILQWMIDATSNILFGKRRWPNLEPIPWTSIAPWSISRCGVMYW